MSIKQLHFHAKHISKDGITVKSVYDGSYDTMVCMGEMIRNICVNLNIDPDTHDGITRNIDIFLIDPFNGERTQFSYNPSCSISKQFANCDIIVLFEIMCRDD